MDAHEIGELVRSVLRHYGVGATVGRVTMIGRDWQVEVVDTSKAVTTVTIATPTAQGVRRAVMNAFDVEG